MKYEVSVYKFAKNPLGKIEKMFVDVRSFVLRERVKNFILFLFEHNYTFEVEARPINELREDKKTKEIS